MGSQGALKNISSEGSNASGWYWVKLQMADGTGKEEDYIFKVELPNKSGTSYPGAWLRGAEIKAWNICLEEPQMSSFQLEL